MHSTLIYFFIPATFIDFALQLAQEGHKEIVLLVYKVPDRYVQ